MLRLIPSWLGVLAGDTNPITRSQPRWLQHRRWVDSELLHSCDGTGIEAAVGGRDGQVLSNAVMFTDVQRLPPRTAPKQAA